MLQTDPDDSSGDGLLQEAVAGAVVSGPPVPRRSAGCRVVGTGPLAARLRRTVESPPSRGTDVVDVLVHHHVVPPDVGLEVARDGRLALPVVVQPRRVLVGPVVGTGAGPCLHCLDLHRRDRDPAWPHVATVLGHPAEQGGPVEVPEAVARATEGVVLLLVGSVGSPALGPVDAGLVHELGPAAPHVVTRRWVVHPACRWHAGDDDGGRPGAGRPP
ncbi:hypothetical protein FB476_2405 [Ornithinimicrobium humiphilum]|uniref:Bacteriocin biosynthesis cyclodehydratase domain-containing protein n=1 Tax=Ornithinimicrobium humiphilum TaxID=125288 RepID=A0A543KQY8_9MICO|nr:hypothetical protein FB476_2405 [Ornithinimicrobium humiphilum]